MPKTLYQLGEINAERAAQGKRYLEFLRVPALSAGVYVLAAGSEDPQTPHQEDEIYYVLRGRARFWVEKLAANKGVGASVEPSEQPPETEDFEVRPGQLVFVPARAAHRFHTIAEELELLVVFGPAEST